jgi:hypothetical protein
MNKFAIEISSEEGSGPNPFEMGSQNEPSELVLEDASLLTKEGPGNLLEKCLEFFQKLAEVLRQ